MGELVIKDKSAVQKTSENEMKKFLTFLLAGETYGVSILKVKEIIEYGEITPMPMMPDFICGAINLRGKVVPVIDLAVRLSKDKSEISKRSCIIIAEMVYEGKAMYVGILVNAVSKVIDLLDEDIENPPSFGDRIRTDFIEGMGKLENQQFVILLKIDAILSMDDLKALSEVRE